MNNFNYKKLSPFKWYVLENFPFIENDFEAINNYRLFSKVVEYLNNTINSMNLTGEQMENVTNAMTNLQNYVNNYFENLDVQEEINNKLDEMAQDGTLENIINQEIFGDINDEIDLINSKNVVAIGDSYGIRNNGWNYYLPSYLGLVNGTSYFGSCEGASGFTVQGHDGHKFIDLLNTLADSITNKNAIKKVVVLGGYNDKQSNYSNLSTAILQFKTRINELFPNATFYIGFIAGNSEISSNASTIRAQLYNTCINFKNICNDLNIVYLRNSELVMKNYSLFSSDLYHPSETGAQKIAHMVFQGLNGQSGIFPNSKSLVQWYDRLEISTDITQNVAYESVHDNIYHLVGNARVLYASNQTLDISNGLYLGSIQNQNYFRPNNETYLFEIPCSVNLQLADNSFTSRNGYIQCNANGDWYFYSRISGVGGITGSLNNVKAIVAHISLSIPFSLC